MKNGLHRFSITISHVAGSTWSFALATLGVLVWLALGPVTGFSNTWLLMIATVTDVIIFLMVFSIQNTQNRDSKAIQLKLNELITADARARNQFIGLESLTDEELSQLDDEFKTLLTTLPSTPVMHKLHGSIRQAKARRAVPARSNAKGRTAKQAQKAGRLAMQHLKMRAHA